VEPGGIMLIGPGGGDGLQLSSDGWLPHWLP
jgi:hypothetical protein